MMLARGMYEVADKEIGKSVGLFVHLKQVIKTENHCLFVYT